MVSPPVDGCWKPTSVSPSDPEMLKDIKEGMKNAQIKLLPDGSLQVKDKEGLMILGVVESTGIQNEFIIQLPNPDGSMGGYTYKNNELSLSFGGISINFSRCLSRSSMVLISIGVVILIFLLFLGRRK